MKTIHSNTLAFIFIVLTAAVMAEPAIVPARLAILAEQPLHDSYIFADLLAAELAAQSDLETVERAEIEKVLTEQKLTATGFNDSAARVQLGQILRADGLIFFSHHVAQGELHLRLAETHHGCIAGFQTFPVKDISQAEIVSELRKMLPKLHLDPAQQTTVSILRFTCSLLPTAVPLSDVEKQFDSVMTTQLLKVLCHEPDIVITERRRLGDIAREQELTASPSDLADGLLLIDGEVATDREMRTAKGDEAVVLTVRIRSASVAQPTIVSIKGTRNRLADLMSEAIDATLRTLRQQRPAIDAGAPQTIEARDLLALARQHGIVWAGEAAYALDPNDVEARDAYLKALLDVGDAQREAGTTLRQPYLEMALALARAEQVASANNLDLWQTVNRSNRLMSGLRRNLEHEITRTDSEILLLLRPFRNLMLNGCRLAAQKQNDPLRKGYSHATLVEWSDALYESPEKRGEYIRSLLQTATTDHSCHRTTRNYIVSYLLTQHDWPQHILKELTAGNDPVQCFYSNYALALITFDPEKQRKLTRIALDKLDPLLQQPGALGSYLILPRQQPLKRHNWLANALEELCLRQPSFKREIHTKIVAHMTKLEAAKDGLSLKLIAPVLEHCAPFDDESPKTEPFASDEKKSRFQSQVLLQAGSVGSDWNIAGPKQTREANNPGVAGDKIIHVQHFGPQRLLVDGDTLWIGLAGGRRVVPDNSGKTHIRYAYGLANYHLPSGKLQATRSGWMETPDRLLSSQHTTIRNENCRYYAPLKPLTRWHDWIVITHVDAGISLLPGLSSASMASAKKELVINYGAGLPEGEITGCAFLDSTLFVVVDGRFVVSWGTKTQKTSMLYDSNRQINDLGLPEHSRFQIIGLWSDPESHHLFFTGNLWQRIGNQAEKNVSGNPRFLSFNTDNSTWNYLKNPPSPPATEDTATLEKARRALETDGVKEIFDLALWQGKIISITGYDDTWKLQLFTEVQND